MRFAAACSFLALAAIPLALAACAEESDGSLRFDEAEQSLVVCQAGEVVGGIDVSYYQGTIDWDAVAGSGLDFAIARINHSTFMDPEFDTNWQRMGEVGMIRGAYQYFEPAEDVSWQAQVVIDKLGKLGPGDLPAVIDVEENGGLPPAQVAQAVSEWLLLVEEGTGKKPMIYSGKYFWQDNVASNAFAGYPLWHAQYPTACQPPAAPPPACGCPNIADQWSNWAVWQYTSSGSVPGIAGNVDTNVFNGSYEELVSFASSGGSLAAKVVQVEAPVTVLAGEAFEVRLTVQNTGGVTWNADTRLGTSEPRDHESEFADPSWIAPNRAWAFTEGLEPGAETTLSLTFLAPDRVGVFVEHFGFVQEGVAWFADQGGPADDAIALSFQVIEGPDGAGGGGVGGAGGDDGSLAGDDEGCSCSAVGRESPGTKPALLLLLAGLLFSRKSRTTGFRSR